MARTARAHETPSWTLADGAASLLGLIARNPTLVGGSTAFLVALSFVSANALWYQPHAHSSAFFATRDFVRPAVEEVEPEETTIIIERPEPSEVPQPPIMAEGDPTVKIVQKTLKELHFYGGDVDGLFGPATRQAIEAYQAKMGLAVTGTVDGLLLDNLGTASISTAVLPSPAPRTQAQPVQPQPAPVAVPMRDDLVARLQVGLREFGNEGIEVDGLMGAKTKAAIREFQSLFGLPETGEPDQKVYAKMKEIGLVE